MSVVRARGAREVPRAACRGGVRAAQMLHIQILARARAAARRHLAFSPSSPPLFTVHAPRPLAQPGQLHYVMTLPLSYDEKLSRASAHREAGNAAFVGGSAQGALKEYWCALLVSRATPRDAASDGGSSLDCFSVRLFARCMRSSA